jgi:hypothetical protein
MHEKIRHWRRLLTAIREIWFFSHELARDWRHSGQRHPHQGRIWVNDNRAIDEPWLTLEHVARTALASSTNRYDNMDVAKGQMSARVLADACRCDVSDNGGQLAPRLTRATRLFSDRPSTDRNLPRAGSGKIHGDWKGVIRARVDARAPSLSLMPAGSPRAQR